MDYSLATRCGPPQAGAPAASNRDRRGVSNGMEVDMTYRRWLRGRKARSLGAGALACALAACLTSGWTARGVRAAQDPEAATPKQGSGIRIVLDRAFINKYADRLTMQSDFVVHQAGKVHKAKDDGELHIAGVATEARLPTVAELMNPERLDVDRFNELERKDAADERTINLEGVWRIWCEHAGTRDQFQGAELPERFPNSNPDHVFEIHPVTKIGDRCLLHTLRPIEGFTPKEAERAILAYENVPFHIRSDGTHVTLDTKGVGFNFVELIVDPDEERNPVVVEDGRFVLCQLRDTDGELIARRRRVGFVKGTDAEEKARTIGEGRLRVVCIPRINLRLVRWRLDNADDPRFDHPLDWDLPYELIVVGLVREFPPEEID
jgi:hypothetical protein